MKSLNNYIKESLLDMDEDSPEMQQAILLEKILEYYKEYGGGDHFIVSNHKHTSFYLDDIKDWNKYNKLLNDFDSFLKEYNINYKRIIESRESLYKFDLGLSVSFVYYVYDRSDFECKCILQTSQINGLKNFNKKL